jgi:hypothetical protein
MPIWFYVFGAIIFGSIVAVNISNRIADRRMTSEERERIDAEVANDLRNFSM